MGRGMSILGKFVGACNRQTKHMLALQGVHVVVGRVYRMCPGGLEICYRLSEIKIGRFQRKFSRIVQTFF